MLTLRYNVFCSEGSHEIQISDGRHDGGTFRSSCGTGGCDFAIIPSLFLAVGSISFSGV